MVNNDNHNFIAKQEHNETYRAKKVISYKDDGSGNMITEATTDLSIRIANDSGITGVQYIGKATPGTATSAAGWQIKRLDETTGTVITFADGDIQFDNVWDDRESLSYS